MSNTSSSRQRTGLLALIVVLILALASEALMPTIVAAERQRGRDDRGAGVEAEPPAEQTPFPQRERFQHGVSTEVIGGQPVSQGAFRFMTFVRVDGDTEIDHFTAGVLNPW